MRGCVVSGGSWGKTRVLGPGPGFGERMALLLILGDGGGPKERQCQNMFKLPHNCTHFTCWQSNAQNFPSKYTTVHEWRTSRCFKLDIEKAEKPEIKWPTSFGSYKKQESSRKKICFIDYTKDFDCVDHKLWKILQEVGIPDHITCLLRNLDEG